MSNTALIESLNIKGNQLNINYNEDGQNNICQSCNDLNESRSALYAIQVHNTDENVKDDHYRKLTDNYLDFHNIKNITIEEEKIINELIKEKFQSAKNNTIIIPNLITLLQDSVYNRLGGSFGHINSESNYNRYELNNIRNKSNNNVQKIEKFKNNWFQNHTNIDWTDQNQNWAKSQFRCINNQGNCGDCWANAATECITMRLSIYTGYYCPLDIIELVNCNYYGYNCNGGNAYAAMTSISTNNIHGIKCTTELYKGGNFDGNITNFCNNNCNSSNNKYEVTCSNIEDLNDNGKWNYTWSSASSGNIMSEEDKQNLINELASGPVSIAIAASSENFGIYNGGVYNWVEADDYDVDHAVLLVGYFTCKSKKDSSKINEYWKIQNSWGTSWGDNGFFYVAATDGNDDFDESSQNKAYPITDPTVCIPSFVKKPRDSIKNYQSPGLTKCCPVGEGQSCTALPNSINYSGGDPIFPMGLDTY